MASKSSPTGSKRTAVIFLDRDGVINESPGEGLYVRRAEEFRFLPGAAEAISLLHRSGFAVCVISNQAGVAKGLYTREDLAGIDRMMRAAAPGAIAGIYYCTHRADEGCDCRKPRTGLVDRAVQELRDKGMEPDMGKSYFIGDSVKDIATGNAAGIRTVLVFSGKEKPSGAHTWDPAPDETAPDLAAAAARIVSAR